MSKFDPRYPSYPNFPNQPNQPHRYPYGVPQHQPPLSPMRKIAVVFVFFGLLVSCCFAGGLRKHRQKHPTGGIQFNVAPERPEPPVAAASAQPPVNAARERGDAQATSLVLVLDTSGSMDEEVPGEGSKLDLAKRVLTEDFLPILSDDLYLSLWRFESGSGLELSPLRKNSSQDAPTWLHREAVMELVERTRADGGTPIAATLSLTRDMLKSIPGRRIVVLVTDGEADEGNVAVVQQLRENTRVGIETFVVGYNLGQQGAYLANELGLGKRYFAANGGRAALLDAMGSISAAIEK